MSNYIVLHTHSVMALLLLLLSGKMYLYLSESKGETLGKKWFQVFYFAEVFWQTSDTIRYSLHPSYFGGLLYQTTVAFMTVPALVVLMVSFTQFLYMFLVDAFPKERKNALRIMVVVGILCIGTNIWNEFFNHSNLIVFYLTAFTFGLLINIWAMIVCFRKKRFLEKSNPEAAKGNYYMGLVNILSIIPSLLVLAFGFYAPITYWSFFVMIWAGNLFQIVIFINFGALPANFETKLAGFTFVIVMTVLMLVTLTFFPPIPPDELVFSLTQQSGLFKMIVVILLGMAIIQFLLPYILSKTLTQPLQRLLTGVQQVNQGDLTTRVQVGLPDEIGDLTQNFNLMTETIKKAQDKLKQYAENLEQQVLERTEEIVVQNKQIEHQRDDLQQTLDFLKTTQNQLIQKEKLASLGELTAGIAHEIQNPLNFVNNFSEISIELVQELNEELDNENMDKDLIKDLLKDITLNQSKINQHGKRASNIVKGMLEHSRSSTGERVLTNINLLADEYLRLSYHGLRAKNPNFNSDFKTNFDPNLPQIEVVAQEIGRVILNLINNAFYAVGQSGILSPKVTVTTKKLENAIEIRVKDNGSGIPKANLARIFQPFFTTKPTGEGTGLGLSLSYDIITKGYGGTLEVISVEGEGAEFIVKLPIIS